MKVLRDDVTFFDKQKFTLFEEFLLYEIFLFMIRPQIIQDVFEEDNLFLVIDKFPVSLSSRIDDKLTRS